METDDYICLAPGFVREAVEVFNTWEDKDKMPRRVQELMIVLKIEVSRRYYPAPEPEPAKIPIFKDMRLG